MSEQLKTIGFIGSGHIGSQLARLAAGHGYHVVVSNSRGPETLQDLVAELESSAGNGTARAGTPAEAAAAGDVVVVTIPLKNIASVPAEPLTGKIVIDTNNYYPERDGQIPVLDNEASTTAELLQDLLPTSHVVKAFNNIYTAHLTSKGTPEGTPGRRALPIAGDSAAAKETVASLMSQFGFDTVDAGALAEGWRFQRDTPAYGPTFDVDQLREALSQAKRYAEMD
ncbi:putative dinucleotide-binding enzyme [Arthrobacter sp. CAN_A212]|uniref:NADPH-dependent F420 reductase n=1 Tax=Arthrobacter sp. CAN_A212 TaxID=2787719 RepID=UPI0018CAC730